MSVRRTKGISIKADIFDVNLDKYMVLNEKFPESIEYYTNKYITKCSYIREQIHKQLNKIVYSQAIAKTDQIKV